MVTQWTIRSNNWWQTRFGAGGFVSYNGFGLRIPSYRKISIYVQILKIISRPNSVKAYLCPIIAANTYSAWQTSAFLKGIYGKTKVLCGMGGR
jgi:hypothetical protein